MVTTPSNKKCLAKSHFFLHFALIKAACQFLKSDRAELISHTLYTHSDQKVSCELWVNWVSSVVGGQRFRSKSHTWGCWSLQKSVRCFPKDGCKIFVWNGEGEQKTEWEKVDKDLMTVVLRTCEIKIISLVKFNLVVNSFYIENISQFVINTVHIILSYLFISLVWIVSMRPDHTIFTLFKMLRPGEIMKSCVWFFNKLQSSSLWKQKLERTKTSTNKTKTIWKK